MMLASAERARAIDASASADWGLDTFALVEAAGRACASSLVSSLDVLFSGRAPRIVALVGSGNNGADALVLLRALILTGKAEAKDLLVFLKERSGDAASSSSRTPRGEALKSVAALGVATRPWITHEASIRSLRDADLIIDGISGTGIEGPLRGDAAEMATALATVRNERASATPIVVSVDVPSGIGDAWRPDMPTVTADLTLAIEPVKACLYLPYARPFAGGIIPVGGVFPAALLDNSDCGSLLDFQEAARAIPPISRSAYKHERGVVEIRAGSRGASGAASLAAKGAQAAGAGLVRLVVDPAIRDTLAVSAGGVMVATIEEAASAHRFAPDCVLAGPGWGRGADRVNTIAELASAERAGLALVLDADAISLAKGLRFNGNAILTPHPGELSDYLGVAKDKLLASPDSYLRDAAATANAVIVLKGHVTRIASSDGRLAVIDGMEPVLAMGGSGDVLAGLAAAIAARLVRSSRAEKRPFDAFSVATAASALLAEAGKTAAREIGFCDPADIARIAGRLAATAWLRGDPYGR